MEILAVGLNEIQLLSEEGQLKKTFISAAESSEGLVVAFDGSFFCHIKKEGFVGVVDLKTRHEVLTIPPKLQGAKSIYLSPRSSFLVVYERFQSNNPLPNVTVYEVKTGREICQCTLKQPNPTNWPFFKWTPNEKFVVYKSADQLNVCLGQEPSMDKISHSVKENDLESFALSNRDDQPLVGIFAKGKNGQPSSIKVRPLVGNTNVVLGSLSVYSVDVVEMKFGHVEQNVLVKIHQEVDASNKSYYGSSSLYLIKISPLPGDSQSICLTTGKLNGTVHDYCWNPLEDEFACTIGALPSETAIYNGSTGNKRAILNVSKHNELKYNTFGKLILLGGFGNLNGAVEIHEKNKVLKLAQGELHCSTMISWAPDGKKFISATTQPRMRVDNCLRVLDFSLAKICEIPFNSLFYSCWIPQSGFTDFQIDPAIILKAKNSQLNGNSGETKEVKAGAYRPPGTRTGASNFADQIRPKLNFSHNNDVKIGRLNSAGSVTGTREKEVVSQKKKLAKEKMQSIFDHPLGSLNRFNQPPEPFVPPPIEQGEKSTPEIDTEYYLKKINNIKAKLDEIKEIENKTESLTEDELLKISQKNQLLRDLHICNQFLEKLSSKNYQ